MKFVCETKNTNKQTILKFNRNEKSKLSDAFFFIYQFNFLLKDSINFDDSLSSLLSGQRKKLGTTSYKRPGPPTPSKNAGRLSFGSGICSSDYGLPREILKEHNDNTMSKKSTPGKIMSLFSSSRVKDEVNIDGGDLL